MRDERREKGFLGAVAAVAAIVLLVAGGIFALQRPGPAPEVEVVESVGAPEMSGMPEHVGTPTPPVAPEEEWVEISPEFPKPMFVSGPQLVSRPNLEKPGKPRTSFKAPGGTRLISRGCEVVSSAPVPSVGSLAMLTDGDKSGSEGSYVELAPGKQWVQVDLGGSREISTVHIWHFHNKVRAYDDVVVQFSDDPAFEGFVLTAFNNDHDNSSGMGFGGDPAWLETNHGRIIDAGGVVARYVRLYSRGNTADDLNHYVEVEVWGR